MSVLREVRWWLELASWLVFMAMSAAIGGAWIFVAAQQGLFVIAPPLWSVAQYCVAAAAFVCLPFGMLGVYGLLACLSTIHRKFRR